MAALPSIENVVSQVRAPQSRVSPGQVASPYQELAANLDKAGEVLQETVAKPYAEQAGHEAVRAGPDGQPIVERAPIFGPASVAYARAARFTAMATLQPQMEAQLTKIKLAHPSNPEGYKIAADAYIKQLIENIPDKVMHSPVMKAASDFSGQQYRSSMVEADHTNLHNSIATFKDRLVEINEKGASLAWQGGTTQPQYEQLHLDRKALYEEQIKDPRTGMTRERADIELKNNRDSDIAQGAIGAVVREYQKKQNAGEAQKALQDFFFGPGSERLNMTPAKKMAAVSEGLRQLERTTMQDSAERQALRSTIDTYDQQIRKKPGTFTDVYHNDLVQQAQKIGDQRSVLMLDAIRISQPLYEQLKGLPPQQANDALEQMSRGLVPRFMTHVNTAIEQEGGRQRVVPLDVIKQIVNIESSGNPNAATPSGTYKGLFQLWKDQKYATKTLDLLDGAASDDTHHAMGKSEYSNGGLLHTLEGISMSTAVETPWGPFRNFGSSGAGLAGDINGDGSVSFPDLNIVLSNFGVGG
jgi:hypothetical protein